MATQYTEDFKRDAVRYWKEHPELGISKNALSTWVIITESTTFFDTSIIAEKSKSPTNTEF